MKTLIGVILLALVVTACQDQQFQDIEAPQTIDDLVVEEGHLTFQALDQIDVFQNIDGYPSLVRVCMEGIAFLMVSRNWYAAQFEKRPYERMPMWADYCANRWTNIS